MLEDHKRTGMSVLVYVVRLLALELSYTILYSIQCVGARYVCIAQPCLTPCHG